MENEFSKVLKNPGVQALYCFIILVLVILIWWYVKKWKEAAEHMEQKDQIYTAGATMRFAQELTSTDELPYMTGYNYQKMKTFDTLDESGKNGGSKKT
jgi:hypothetical protein